jgi:hypothetical protein
MQQEIRELQQLPLEDLITAPLNAVITAQANAALSTANFIQQIGFRNKQAKRDGSTSIFDLLNKPADPAKADDQFEVRTAELIFVKKENRNGELVDTFERASLPFITLFNIPSIEISEMTWDFSAKLKGIEAFETALTHSTRLKGEVGGNVNAGLQELGVPIGIGASAKVEVSTNTKFELRYGSGHEHEYNLNISIKANAAPQPRGIERLLGIAERIAAANEAAQTAPVPVPAPIP